MRFGLFSALAMGVLRDPNPPVPAGGGGAPPLAPAPAAPPTAPFATFDSQAALDDRLARAGRAALRDATGLESADEVKARLARLKQLEDAETERARAELTATQRLEADLATERARVTAMAAERDQERFRSVVSGACAQLGVKNLKYAQYLVAEAAEALPEGQQLDPDTYLRGLLEKPEYKTAFGIEAVPAVVPAPVTTSPNPGAPPPAPPAPGNGGGPPDVMAMNPTQFREHLEKYGAGSALS
jgi:hypothetical protein